MKGGWRAAVTWLLVAEGAYAVMRVATRSASDAAEVHWAEVASARFLGGALVAFAAARMRGASLRVTDQRNAWLRSLFGTGGAICLFHALGTSHIAVGDATTLYATTPLWVALLAGPVLGERVPIGVWAGVALGFAGVATLMGARLGAGGWTALLVLVGAVSYALAILRLRQLSTRESSEAIALHMSLTAGGILALIALPHVQPLPSGSWLPIALSALAGGLGQVAVGRAYARGTASSLAALGYVGVVFTYALEAALFRRLPAPHQVAGALMVIAAGVAVAFASRPAAQAAEPAASAE